MSKSQLKPFPAPFPPVTVKELKTRPQAEGYKKGLNIQQEYAMQVLYQHQVPVADVAAFFGISSPAVSYHWQKFRKAGVIKYKRVSIETILHEAKVIK